MRAGAKSLLPPAVVNKIRRRPKKRLAEVDFDIGYFLLPNITWRGATHGHAARQERVSRKSFSKIRRSTRRESHRRSGLNIFASSHGCPYDVKFFGGGRMSSENEILAYKKFLERLEFPRESTLIVKPHPRDAEEKIQRLGKVLRESLLRCDFV